MAGRVALGFILVAAGLAGCGEAAREEAARGARAGEWTGRVVRVVDGDTVRVRVGGREERVRYIGIDTPEPQPPQGPECFARAASAYNARLVGGERVRLRFDAERRDRYGRLLAYVHRADDGLFVNAALVRGGFATVLTVAPNDAHEGLFRRLERRARRAGRGLWGAC